MIYADTSLLLPIYVPEVNSETANNVVKGAEELLISDLTVAEFLVGLARKVKLGTLPQELASQVRLAFEQHMAEGYLHRIPLASAHSEAAGQLAVQSPVMLRTLDALHLAVAVEHEATMATLDGRLSDAARAMGVEVLP
ncbi:MAG TPA: type II toxin-antitoxin system VapC family toxin [Thermoanaerobaculia bacterium]|nr:type II toxin-antitoxin system VapC family toxin [Thermoanaerobaculia bacterium]